MREVGPDVECARFAERRRELVGRFVSCGSKRSVARLATLETGWRPSWNWS